MSSQIAGKFLWGKADEVRALDDKRVPSFRLVNTPQMVGDIACVNWEMYCSQISGELIPEDAPMKVVERNGRAVATFWEDMDAEWCFIAGVVAPDLTKSGPEQTTAVFETLEDILREGNMTFANVVRTWLYIDRVCEWYKDFNAARTRFFESRNVFNTFLPASTGIGSANIDGGALMAGLIAMKPHAHQCAKCAGTHAETVESPLQCAAMAYKSSFSRAAQIIQPDRKILFVSGTASIKPNSHEVAFVGDVPKQIDCTMNAVHAILTSQGCDWQDVPRAIVYLKDASSLAEWEKWREAHGLPEGFAQVTVCDVCRDEWLFEIELDAVRATV